MTAIPENPDALLTRNQTAIALTEAGFPVATATLATKATRGGGPAYQKFGPRAMYRWGTAFDWAMKLLKDPVRSTSESALPCKSSEQASKAGAADAAVQRSPLSERLKASGASGRTLEGVGSPEGDGRPGSGA